MLITWVVAEKEPGAVFYSPPEVIRGLLQWDYSDATITPRTPAYNPPSVAAAHRTPQDGRPSEAVGLASVFVPLTAILQGSVLKKRTFFLGAFAVSKTRAKGALFAARCTKNATSRRTQQPARLSSSAPFNSPPTLDSRLSTHSSSTLDLDSLSTLETCDPATARVDSEASSSTVALRKAFSMVATIPCRFIVCDPHASSSLVLRFGTGDPHRSPSPTRAPSPGHPPAVVPTSESD